ncbi:serine/threonine-protein kinase [Rhodococcus sp. Q]|uniref:serine/threonine-protein kinase n=1 Tax=Rhodococcus sp. Q TaxID=2502252 RepID=UPI0010F8A06A|nr:serine/threonine-protein kinase [Rhodococcus sp. Q]
MSLQNGALIADRYRLMRLIATGGMGQVWEATDNRLHRRVAVKVLKAEFSSDPEFLARFRTEARTTAQLNHPGIAGIYDYGETRDTTGQDTAYLVMELVNGEPLNAVLSRVGRLSLPHALDMLEQTGRALQAAHASGVVHRDVKPGNILITPTGQVKITDFGIAKAVEASPVTRTGMVMGTAQYIAPEQALGQDATPASDVYALGVVGYEVLAGHRPFSGDGALTVAMKHVQEIPAPLPADLPPNVRELIEITMAKDPAARYHSGGEFADAVTVVRSGGRPPMPGSGAPTVAVAPPTAATQVIGRQPTTAAAAAVVPEPSGLTHNQKVVAWVAGGLIGLGLLVGGWMLLFGGGDAPSSPAKVTTSRPAVTTPAPTTARPTTTTEEPTTTEWTPEPTTEEPTTTTTEPPTTTTERTTTTTTEPPTTTTTVTTTLSETTTSATQGQP